MKSESLQFSKNKPIYSDYFLERAHFFRALALEIDENPAEMSKYTQHSFFREICQDQSSTCLERTQLIEALSYGDAGALLASPGPSLAGLMVRELGDEKQQEYFFSYLLEQRATTFLAVTEPKKGSDASLLETRIIQKSENITLISGEKCLVGHAADASIGVLMARGSNGPLGLKAILLGPEFLQQDTITRMSLDSIGLRGARLGQIILKDAEIDPRMILGSQKNPIRGGLMAMLKTFNRMRPGVAAFALGHIQAMLDYACEKDPLFFHCFQNEIQEWNFEISGLRTLLYSCAKQVDTNPYENYYASLSKWKASKIAEKIAIKIVSAMGKSLLELPLLMKWYRDSFGFEYMEGSSTMQLKNLEVRK